MSKVYHAALAMLARQEYTEKGLTKKLMQKGFDEDAIAIVIEKLKQDGMQSDRRYAESYLSMRKKKGFGPNYIKKALAEKGIDSALIEAVLSSETWLNTALSVWHKKYKSYTSDLPLQAKQKQFLYYRGFDTDTIHQLFSELSSNSEAVDNEEC